MRSRAPSPSPPWPPPSRAGGSRSGTPTSAPCPGGVRHGHDPGRRSAKTWRADAPRRHPPGSVAFQAASALQRPPSFLPRLRLLALPLDRRLLVVLAPLHLLKEAVLQHVFLERLERGLDLVVEDLDPHSTVPQVRG